MTVQALPSTSPVARVLFWAIELRFWVATCVTALCAFAQAALGLEHDPLVLGVVGLSTLAIYNLDGSLDASAGDHRPGSSVHVALTLFAGVGSLVVTWCLPPAARWLVLVGLALCLPYALGGASSVRERSWAPIKALPGLKAPFVGCAVATAVVVLPALSSEPADVDWVAGALLLAVIGVFCTSNAILFDLVDLREDLTHGVPTLPCTRGPGRARRRVQILCLVGCGACVAVGWMTNWPVAVGLAALGCLLTAASDRVDESTTRGRVALWIDGALILPWVVQSLAP